MLLRPSLKDAIALVVNMNRPVVWLSIVNGEFIVSANEINNSVRLVVTSSVRKCVKNALDELELLVISNKPKKVVDYEDD